MISDKDKTKYLVLVIIIAALLVGGWFVFSFYTIRPGTNQDNQGDIFVPEISNAENPLESGL